MTSGDALSPLSKPPMRKGGGKQVSAGLQCQAAGTGLEGGEVGVAQIIQVQCRDANDNRRTTGGDIVLVSMTPEGGRSTDAHVIDNIDGTYTCTYLPTVASPNCRIHISVNGTRIVGSPFSAQVTPGPTSAHASEVYGRGLYDGIAGQPCNFTIVTKDTYGNRCTLPGDKFSVVVKPVQSLLPELATFLRKYEVHPIIEDNEDGTHSVSFTAEYAGFFTIHVTLASQPVGEAPFNVCICNPTIAFPSELAFNPLEGKAELAPPEGAACPPATDMIQVDQILLALKSEPIERTGGRPTREYVHSYRLPGDRPKWKRSTIRSSLPHLLPPPHRRVCLPLSTSLLALCHADEEGELTGITEVRTLDMCEAGAEQLPGWTLLKLDGRPPNALEGYAAAVWEGRDAVLVCGGQNEAGACVADIWMLSLGGVGSTAASWRPLAEWPSSNFSGEGCGERKNHSMTLRPGANLEGKARAEFWIFGGRGADDELLNTLYYFDMDEESWSSPQCLGAAPEPREHHAACFVAERYLVIYGGLNEEGDVIDSTSVYDVLSATWSTVGGMQPRAYHRLAERGGIMFVMGGIDAEKNLAPSIPLKSEIFPFSQQACLAFEGNNVQCVSIKPSPSLMGVKNAETGLMDGGLKRTFTVEALINIRSLSTAYSPIIVKSDGSLKAGFGLMAVQHPTPAIKFPTGAIVPGMPPTVPPDGPWIHFFVGGVSLPTMVGCEIKLGEWMHVAGTYDGTNLKIYVNGANPSEGPATEALRATPTVEYPLTEEEGETLHTKGDVLVGGVPGKFAFDGQIDECRLWDMVRTEDDLKAHMNTPFSNPVTQHLLGQWTFNEGSGETCIDSGGQKNHGTFDRYAGGVELRRVQSKRGRVEPFKSESERHIEAQFEKLNAWKKEFEKTNGRWPSMADTIMAPPEISGIARRMGEFGGDAGDASMAAAMGLEPPPPAE